ncbi:hydantoinase/oxoprolinase family protein [Pseudaminobacter salicylatoxidans]|uniref:hydantoinase/oxoprolinase family protein n=1 Tax=Pseudaminobacter salicylatoxidans TaxID=93369 RepID=UPI0002FE7536|nr:hydantoinase/oxoprolinase family protein [Pseudaminobacter salicylatoxidans]
MVYEIAVDVGGTFTDLVIKSDAGMIKGVKSPTTPGNIIDGTINAVVRAAEALGLSLAEVMGDCRKFAFGTTTATNAVLEGKGARTGLLCTRGHRDVLLIREGGKDDTYNVAVDFPGPYIPRRLTLEIDERVDAEGGVVKPLDEAQARRAISGLLDQKVDAIAVALIWSVANSVHEERLAALIEEMAPSLPYSLSHKVSPSIREYRRTSATALDASLKPIVNEAVRTLSGRLAAEGFRGVLTLVTSSGGQTSPQDVQAKPIYLCFSGPSAAPESGRRFARLENVEGGNIVTVDMGGTSFDVSIVSDWEIPTHRDGVIAGHSFGVPSVEVLTIGAGGGSLARVDAGGFVHTGPESAGSRPGPACYGRGGTRVTVTDANVVRGYLNPLTFAAGTMMLDAEAARTALRQDVAEPLGVEVDEAAELVCVTCDQSMVGAIEEITIKRGIDPREYVMVAGGAAAGLHAVAIARELDIAEVIVPRFAGVLSAFGILTSNVQNQYGRSIFTRSDAFDLDAVNQNLAELKTEAQAYLARMGVEEPNRRLEFTAEARYQGQVWQLTLPLQTDRFANAGDVAAMVEDFHCLHERLYNVRSAADAVEIIEINVKAIGLVPEITLPQSERGEGRPYPSGVRSAFFREAGRIDDVPVYQGETLRAGHVVEGPALIEEPLTAIVVPPGAVATISDYGNYRIST